MRIYGTLAENAHEADQPPAEEDDDDQLPDRDVLDVQRVRAAANTRMVVRAIADVEDWRINALCYVDSWVEALGTATRLPQADQTLEQLNGIERAATDAYRVPAIAGRPQQELQLGLSSDAVAIGLVRRKVSELSRLLLGELRASGSRTVQQASTEGGHG